MNYKFEVPGKIVGKERPRVNTNTLTVYTPNKTKDYENLILQYFQINNPGCIMLEGRIGIEIVAYLKIPKATTKVEKEKMLKGEISPTKKPDIDNIVKAILDSMNKFAFKDDNQITKIEVEKKYALEDKLYVKIEEY